MTNWDENLLIFVMLIIPYDLSPPIECKSRNCSSPASIIGSRVTINSSNPEARSSENREVTMSSSPDITKLSTRPSGALPPTVVGKPHW